MSVARRIAKNSAFQAVAYGAQSLTAFILPLYLARAAGAELLGQFAAMLTFASIFASISIFGLPSLLIREIARHRDNQARAAELVGASIGLVALLSVVAAVLMIVTGWLLRYPDALIGALALTSLALGLESIARVTECLFRGIEEMEWSALIIAVMEISFLVLALVIVPFQPSIVWLIGGYLVSRGIALAIGLRLARTRLGIVRAVFHRELWWSLLKSCFPFAVNNSLSSVYVRIDVIFLSSFVGHIAVGLYEAANNLTMRVNILARVVTMSMYPVLSSQFIRDRDSAWKYTARVNRYLVILGFFIAVILWVFGQDIVLFLYGEQFGASVQAMRFLALIIPLRFVDNSLAVVLSASNREGKRAIAVGVAAAVNVALNMLLIPDYGIMGAVYSTITTEIVLLSLFAWYLRGDVRKVIEWDGFIGPLLGIAAVLGVSLLIHAVNIWLLGALSLLAYGLIIYWVDPTSMRDLRLIVVKRSQ